PIVVAVNKVDRPGAHPERVKQQVAEHGLLPDEWRGDTLCVPISALEGEGIDGLVAVILRVADMREVEANPNQPRPSGIVGAGVPLSALKGEGIDELLEMILLVADMRELKANPNRPASGVIVEARLDRGRGPVATVLVQNGTLRLGDVVVAGPVAGKVRAMLNEWGEPMEEAGPATPVEVLGFQDVPEAGDLLEVVADEREARQRAEAIAAERQLPEAKGGVVTLSQLATRGQAEVKELNLVLKADVQGTLEAVRQSLERLSTDE